MRLISRQVALGEEALNTSIGTGTVVLLESVLKVKGMRLVLNVLWITFGGGFALALQYLLGGLLLCLTVVGLPFGLQCFKLAKLSLLPFGHDVEDDPTLPGSGGLGLIANLFWFVFGGATTFLTHIGFGLASAITIIGIPFALQHLKLAVLSLFPFGRRVVEVDGR